MFKRIMKVVGFMFGVACFLYTFHYFANAQKLSHFEQMDTVMSTETLPLSCDILVGDVNADGAVDIDDAVVIIQYSIGGGEVPLGGGYQSVRQAYIRTYRGRVVIDTLGDTLLQFIDLIEIGDIYYVPEVDSL